MFFIETVHHYNGCTSLPPTAPPWRRSLLWQRRGEGSHPPHMRQQGLQAVHLECLVGQPEAVPIHNRLVAADLVGKEGGQPLLKRILEALQAAAQ